MKKNILPTYIGIFLISVATLVLEISLTRLFSVMQWYHFAFMVISIALLGFGAAGTFLSVFPWVLKRDTNKLLMTMAGLFSISTIICFIAANHVPFDPFRIVWDHKQMLYLGVYYLLFAIPFFFSGACIAAAMTKIAKKVNKIYFSDLVGAGIGSLLVIVLFSFLEINIIVFSALLGGFAALSFSVKNKKTVYAISVWLIILLLILLFVPLKLNISPYKSLSLTLKQADAKVIFTKWNSFSKIDIIDSPTIRYAPGLSYKYKGMLPKQYAITVDGDSLNAITKYEDLEFIDYLPSSLAYGLVDENKVLVIEPGGGLDVLTALRYNKSVAVAEPNPIIVDAIKDEFKEFSGGIYSLISVEGVNGRSFIRKTKDRFDIIQLSLAGNVITTSTGIYGLNENYLYTTDAFRDYYSHLSEDGILTITRYLMFPPRETIRIVSLAVGALEELGVKNHSEHIALIRTLTTTTFLLKKSPFTDEEIDKIKQFCDERQFDIIYMPGVELSDVNKYNELPEPYFYQMVVKLFEDKDKLYQEYLFDISPVGDDKPYFSNFFKYNRLKQLYESMGKKWEPFFEGGFIVIALFIQALLLSLLFIFLPVYIFKRLKEKITGKGNILGYFFCIGVGFMFIEISLIQRFILFLDHPIYAISVVLFSLLIFSGIGSFLSGKVESRKLNYIILILAAIVLVYLFLFGVIFNVLLGHHIVIRCLVALLLIAPLGLVMGMPFPIGIRIADKRNNKLVPWAWAVNGCSSVLSSIAAIIIAMVVGFSVVLLIAAAVYVIGLAIIRRFAV
ncbi:hypothetical protein KY345_03845 [Candidatus Woesearchaeota archaeon]|nr:hypothetical protein [Candidatus Woesearchaeota archaeon]